MSRFLTAGVLSQGGLNLKVQRGIYNSWSDNRAAIPYEFTLSEPVPVGKSFATIHYHHAEGDANNIPTIQLFDVVGGHYTKCRIDSEAQEDTFRGEYAYQIVTSPIINVQEIKQNTYVPSSDTVNHTISAVDPSKTLVFHSGGSNNQPRRGFISARLTSSTNVRLQKGVDFSENWKYVVYVVEIPLASVVNGTVSLTGTSVDVSLSGSPNTFCLYSHYVDSGAGNINDGDITLVRGSWVDNNTYRFSRGSSTSTLHIAYSFVTISGTNLIRGNVNINNNAQTADLSVSAVDTSKVMFIASQFGNSETDNSSNFREATVMYYMANSTTIRASRHDSSIGNVIASPQLLIS